MLQWKWSPQEITATLKRAFPNELQCHVSHKTIYTAIYAHSKGELRRYSPQPYQAPPTLAEQGPARTDSRDD
jgi:IS30 family transposase